MNFSIELVADVALSIIGVGISVLAIIQTNTELKYANKQAMFDRRLEFHTFIYKLFVELKEKKEKIETKRSISDIDALEQFLTCDCIDTSHMDINEILDHKNRDNVKRNIRQIKECIVQFDLLFNVNEESNIKIMMEQYYKLWTVSLNNAESIEKAKRFAVNDLDDEYEIRGQIIHLMETIKNMDDGEFAKLKQTIELCQPKTLMEIFGAYINEKVDKMVNAALLKEMSKKEMQ